MRILVLLVLLLFPFAAHAQQTIFVPTCSGVDDTAAFQAIIIGAASNPRTIRIPYKADLSKRCKVNTLLVPSYITLDNTDGSGIFVVTGQTLTVAGPRVNPAGKTMFFNVAGGQGTLVISGGQYLASNNLSVPPALANNPIAVGDNDPRNTDSRIPSIGAPITISIPFDGDGTTVINKLVKVVDGVAVPTAITDTSGAIGIVIGGSTNLVTVAKAGKGIVLCSGGFSFGDYLVISSTQAGRVKSVGQVWPSSGQVIGRAIVDGPGSGGEAIVDIFGSEVRVSDTNPPAGALYWAINYPSFAAAVTAMGTTVPVRLIVSEQMAVAADVTVTPNIQLQFVGNGRLIVATNKTITIQGSLLASPSQWIFDVSASGAAISFVGNRSLTEKSPFWFGLDPTGVADNSPLWNKIVNFLPLDDQHWVFPLNTIDNHASTVTVSSRAGFTLTSHIRVANGGGAGTPQELWTGSSGGMWDFQANQAPTVEGFLFTNTANLDYYLRFDGNPSTRIGTNAWMRFNGFVSNTNNPNFKAVTINEISGQNHENNVIADNLFVGSQQTAVRLSDSGVITNTSDILTCGAGNCTWLSDPEPRYRPVAGERIRVSYATGIQDKIVLSVIDDNHLRVTTPFTATQANARIHRSEALGYGIVLGSVNTKHNTIERNQFIQCARGLSVTNGSFSAQHFGGYNNDILAYIGNTSEPSELAYEETEGSLVGVYVNNAESQLTLSHLRNGLSGGGLSNGYIYLKAGQITIRESQAQNAPITNAVLIGAPTPGNVSLSSTDNFWGPASGGDITMDNLGFNQWRTLSEADSTFSGFLHSSGDSGITDAPGGDFQFGAGLNLKEGHVILGNPVTQNFPSFSIYTAQPHATNNFVNEAIGYTTSTFASGNNATRRFIGFDTNSDNPSVNNFKNGGNYVGSRFTFPTGSGIIEAIAFHGKAPLGNTGITTAYGVKIEDLASVTGITNKFAFKSVGASDVVDIAGPLKAGSLRGNAVAFASLPASPVEGMLVAVTDSNTAVWGAVIAGGGANHVLAYYNGTNWTVCGK